MEEEPYRVQPPGLRAAIVYLRPYLRPPLLAGLARLGIFICEHTDTDSLVVGDSHHPIDVLIVVADSDSDHVPLAGKLAEQLGGVLVSVVPTRHSASRYSAAADVIADDDELRDHFDAVIAAAARQARARQLKRISGTT